MTNAIVFGDADVFAGLAVRRLGAALPRLTSRAQGIEWLGLDDARWNALLQRISIPQPGRGMGYDAEPLLQARLFLQSSLTERELDEALGISGLTSQLIIQRLLQP
jgi:hypothetical protein